MIERLTNADTVDDARRRIAELIGAHGEWFLTRDGGAPAALRQSECDFSVAHGRLIFSCWSNEGLRAWRVVAWEWTGEKLLLDATRRMGAERAALELIPRASSGAITETVANARRWRCERLAQLACTMLHGARVERAALSVGARRGQPGRYARVLLRLQHERIALTGIAADKNAGDVDAFLSSALIWFARACEKARAPYIQKMWLVVRQEDVGPTAQRVALLRDDLRRVITLYKIDEAWQELTPVCQPEREALWTEQPECFRRPGRAEISEGSARIIALAPQAIDVVRARHGETLRYHGLAFARVRRVMNRESVWFGVEGTPRRLLDESSWPEWTRLLSELKTHRSAEASDHRHIFYKAAPEAWLESLLRPDITRLDPGLIISPLHAQFRTSWGSAAGSRPIDLLALRRDGRLVVIELKVSEDPAHVLQGADYWRRVEAHRRHGHIAGARLFDQEAIADDAPLVYLVAPILRFHRAYHTLARAIDPEIEIYRFDINEDWRAGVRVMRRTRSN